MGMSNAQRRPMTLDEFLAWERRQELRFEFDGVAPVAMTGGTANHAVIADNVADALRRSLKLPCRVFRNDLKILTNGRVRYPDAVVTCSHVRGTTDILPNPVVVFEVLSPSTAAVDRVTKNAEYAATPSIQRYVMLEQVRIGATVFARHGADWVG
jgi:Uma2 family endonuclease